VTGSGRTHAAAVKAALEAAGLRVYMGGAPAEPVFPYVAVYHDAGMADQTSLAMVADHYVHTFQTSCVAKGDVAGKAHEQCSWVAEKVRGALAGKRLTVSGWNNGLIDHLMSAPISVDYDAPTDVRQKFDQWRYRAAPSS
jgi:hypothetical protein